MYHFTIPMALVDFLPVLFFGYAAALLQQDLYDKMRKSHFALFAAGTINIFTAGFLKALWKLLYAANICDFHALNTMFLPVQSIGFLLAGLGIFDDMAKRAGAGTLVPITGFANAIAAPAVEFQTEGRILGTAAKMFTIAGPVIVYGVTASVIYGVIYWLYTV